VPDSFLTCKPLLYKGLLLCERMARVDATWHVPPCIIKDLGTIKDLAIVCCNRCPRATSN
jgi:hypothetical protein